MERGRQGGRGEEREGGGRRREGGRKGREGGREGGEEEGGEEEEGEERREGREFVPVPHMASSPKQRCWCCQ